MLRSFFALASIGLLAAFHHASAEPSLPEDLARVIRMAQGMVKVEDAMEALRGARTFRCQFAKGHFLSAKNGEFSSKFGDFMPDGAPLIIDNIDFGKGSARVIANNGAEDLKVFTAGNGVNFIEIAGGTVNLYTVLNAATGRPDEFYAVTSRHLSMVGEFSPSQYPGTCKIWAR